MKAAQTDCEFRSLRTKDFGLLEKWLAAPHVRQWRGDPADALRRIREAGAGIATEALIIEIDGRPAGYIQACDPHLEAVHPCQDQPTGTQVIDCFIGETVCSDEMHAAAIAGFAALLFEEGAPRLIAVADPDNEPSISAYRRAGFAPLGLRQVGHGTVLLMVLDNCEPLEGE